MTSARKRQTQSVKNAIASITEADGGNGFALRIAASMHTETWIANGKKTNNRRPDKKLAGSYYKRKFKWLNRCIYCGEPATCLDHVFPLSAAVNLECYRPQVRKELFQGLNLVPSCHECNTIASDHKFTSIIKKRAYIKSKLREKHIKKSRSIIWDDEDMAELGKTLLAYIKKKNRDKERIENRLIWPAIND